MRICEIACSVQAKRERRKDARPGELLEAALELFVEKGYAATRVEEVAKCAGVSKGTLFLYFASKEDLFKAVVRANISVRFEEWNTEMDTFTGSSAELIRHCMQTWWEKIGSTKASGISKLMMSEAGNFPELAAFYQQEVVQPGHALVGRVLQRGMDSGEFRQIDTKYGAYTVIAPLMFLALWRHSLAGCCAPANSLVPEEYLAAQCETILYGLGVRHKSEQDCAK